MTNVHAPIPRLKRQDIEGAGADQKGNIMAKSPKNEPAAYPNPFGGLFGRMMRETATMQAEMLQFISKRVSADIAASQEILTAKSPTEAAEAVQAYYQRAFEDYLSQTNEMIDAACSIAQDVHVPHEWRSKVAETGEDEKSLNT